MRLLWGSHVSAVHGNEISLQESFTGSHAHAHAGTDSTLYRRSALTLVAPCHMLRLCCLLLPGARACFFALAPAGRIVLAATHAASCISVLCRHSAIDPLIIRCGGVCGFVTGLLHSSFHHIDHQLSTVHHTHLARPHRYSSSTLLCCEWKTSLTTTACIRPLLELQLLAQHRSHRTGSTGPLQHLHLRHTRQRRIMIPAIAHLRVLSHHLLAQANSWSYWRRPSKPLRQSLQQLHYTWIRHTTQATTAAHLL
jgi:hypothetical protein